MYSRWISVLAISLVLSSCAFMDGLHSPQDKAPAASNGNGKKINAPAAIAPPPVNNQTNATSQAAKTLAPLDRP